MKHTFWYIDELMKLLAKIPGQLKSDDDLGKVERILNKIQEYNWKLGKLIDAHKTPEHLNRLHFCHVDNIPNWAGKVDDHFRKLDALMRVLYEDIPKLKAILQEVRKEGSTRQNPKNSNPWSSKVADMSMGMVMAGFHHEEEDMEEFRRAEIFERKHLEEILGDLSDIEELLK